MLALELIHLGTDRSKNGLGALKLGKNAAVKSGRNRTIDLRCRSSGNLGAINNDGSRGGGDRSRLGGGGGGGLGSLGGSRCLDSLDCGRSSSSRCGDGRRCDRGSGSGRRRSRLDHVVGYTLMSKVFLSCF